MIVMFVKKDSFKTHSKQSTYQKLMDEMRAHNKKGFDVDSLLVITESRYKCCHLFD